MTPKFIITSLLDNTYYLGDVDTVWTYDIKIAKGFPDRQSAIDVVTNLTGQVCCIDEIWS